MFPETAGHPHRQLTTESLRKSRRKKDDMRGREGREGETKGRKERRKRWKGRQGKMRRREQGTEGEESGCFQIIASCSLRRKLLVPYSKARLSPSTLMVRILLWSFPSHNYLPDPPRLIPVKSWG